MRAHVNVAWPPAIKPVDGSRVIVTAPATSEEETTTNYNDYEEETTTNYNDNDYYSAFFGIEGHVALDIDPCNILLLRMIPGDLLSACSHRQFHTLPGLLDSWAALSNSYPNAYVLIREAVLYHFYDGLWYGLAGARTHDLPHERWTS